MSDWSQIVGFVASYLSHLRAQQDRRRIPAWSWSAGASSPFPFRRFRRRLLKNVAYGAA